MNHAIVDVFVDEQVRAANRQVNALREAQRRVDADERLAQLWKLRRAGWTLEEALEEVERAARMAPANDRQ
jgi:hypothetical protein